jgi:hypothetical protein
VTATYLTTATITNSTVNAYTIPSSSTVPYGSYVRDLVVNNGGPSTLFLAFGSGLTTAATTSSFGVPTGGTVVLTNCQVPQSNVLCAISAGTSVTSVGFATNVSVD